MRRALAVVLAAFVILGSTGTAHAEQQQGSSGWARYKKGSKAYVFWHTKVKCPPDASEAQLRFCAKWKAAAIWRARKAHRIWMLTRLRHPTVRQAEAMIRYLFKSRAGIALRVGYCESGLRWWKKNPRSSASGIYQFLSGWWRGKWDPFHAWVNIKHAYWASNGGRDWGPWNASRGCWA